MLLNTSDLVFISKTNNLVTDSRHVAEYFGERAAEIKERYINAFNQIESELSSNSKQLPPTTNPIDDINFMYQHWMVLVEKGEITSKRPLSDDEYLFNRRQFINYFREPDVTFQDVD